MLVILVASVARVQLWELAPGSAEAVAPRMSFGEDATAYAARYQTDGEIMFVTALGSRLSLLDALAAWRDEDVNILTFEERFGTQTPSQQRESNARAMVSSKQIALISSRFNPFGDRVRVRLRRGGGGRRGVRKHTGSIECLSVVGARRRHREF